MMTCRRLNFYWITVLAGVVPVYAQNASRSATYTDLFDFYLKAGTTLTGNLVEGLDGNLYGTADYGGATNSGTAFRATTTGIVTKIHNFCTMYPSCPNGIDPEPYGALAVDTDGSFYGTTLAAKDIPGTVFRITSNGGFTTIYNACFSPYCFFGSGVVKGADGSFYGTNPDGGTNTGSVCFHQQCGEIFRITEQGTFTSIYSFCSQAECADGGKAYGPLVSGIDGDLYGITSVGGANGFGTVFKLTLSGKLTTLHTFDSADGNCFDEPCAPLIEANNGLFYGTTSSGGSNLRPHTVFGAGTVFEITPNGTFSTLYNFCAQSNCADGYDPGSLVQASDGGLYGTTSSGGIASAGTFFSITPEGALTTLYNFDLTQGSEQAGVIQSTDGSFYGLEAFGGESRDGTLFRLSVGLAPFIKTLPTYGRAGAQIKILGNALTDTTSVSFNGTPAMFNIVSATEIDATVPAGAKSGRVQLTTATGALVSNTRFRIRP